MRELSMKRTLLVLWAGFAWLLASNGATALTLQPKESAQELIIATKIAPPFAMRDADGQWTGISIELWQRVAEKLKLPYHFVEEPTVQRLIEGTSDHTFDAAIAAITITAVREN